MRLEFSQPAGSGGGLSTIRTSISRPAAARLLWHSSPKTILPCNAEARFAFVALVNVRPCLSVATCWTRHCFFSPKGLCEDARMHSVLLTMSIIILVCRDSWSATNENTVARLLTYSYLLPIHLSQRICSSCGVYPYLALNRLALQLGGRTSHPHYFAGSPCTNRRNTHLYQACEIHLFALLRIFPCLSTTIVESSFFPSLLVIVT